MQKGFSLVELLVVVAIIGVLAGVGIVGYDRYALPSIIALLVLTLICKCNNVANNFAVFMVQSESRRHKVIHKGSTTMRLLCMGLDFESAELAQYVCFI